MHSESFGSARVTGVVASGRVTDIYRATQQPLGREVVVKSLKSTLSPSSPLALPLQREAQVLSLLRHDNIVGLVDYGRDERRMWLVLQWIDGFTLRRVLDTLAESSEREPAFAVAIAMQVARALAHAHERGVIHCDLRPSNLLVGRDGRVTLIDFASAIAEQLPAFEDDMHVSEAVNAPSYMTPEQVLGEAVDARTDIFALGVVLYELLSGKAPFAGTDERSLAHSVRHDEPASLGRGVPRRLAQIVAKCLQKLPSDRFSSAHALYDALAEVYGNLTTEPRRKVITSVLARVRLIDRPTNLLEDRLDLPTSQPVRPSLVPALWLLVALSGVMLAGLIGIHYVFREEIAQMHGASQGPLLLVPERAASLRVLAQPWAHVFVNGQFVDTTPFARAIPLSAGVHHVTLRHPAAPDERRTIKLSPGERLVLDVAMNVKKAPKPTASALPPPSPSTP